MSPVSFFMLAASLQRLAVVRFQHLAQPRFRVKHLPSQKYEGQHAVVAVFLQGASADTEQFRHLTVSQVTFPVQRRAVTFQKYRQPFRAFAHILHHRGYRLVFHRKNIVVLVHHNFGFISASAKSWKEVASESFIKCMPYRSRFCTSAISIAFTFFLWRVALSDISIFASG